MRNIERTLTLLERVAIGPPASQAELVRDLGVSRSTMSDLLGELRALGYVSILERRYVPGVRMLSLVMRASREAAITAGVQSTLRQLSERLGETAIFVVPASGGDPDQGMQVVSVEEAQSPLELRYVAQIGKLYPARTTTAGHALLAFGPDAQGELTAEERALVRRRGYALTEEETRGATIIAAPVLDGAGHPIGAISVIGPTARMGPAETRLWPALREAVAQLERAPEPERGMERG